MAGAGARDPPALDRLDANVDEGRSLVFLDGSERATQCRADLARLPGVTAVAAVGRENDALAYDVTTVDGALSDVQRAITAYAVEARLTLISNTAETLDLETVFLRLIDQKELAA